MNLQVLRPDALDYTPEVVRATAAIHDKVRPVIPDLEWPVHAPYIAAINELKRQRNAVALGGLATRSFVITRGDEVMFDVIRRIWRRNAFMAVVVGKGRGTPHAGDVLGVITKDHVADWVAASIQMYPGER